MSKLNYFLEDGSEVVDTNFDSYNLGTQLMLEILCEQGCEFESIEQYENVVKDLEGCRDQDDVERVMYNIGTDYIDELEGLGCYLSPEQMSKWSGMGYDGKTFVELTKE